MNVAIVRGRLSSDPRRTALSSGDVLVRYEVTVSQEGAPADSVPVAWLGTEGAAPNPGLATGDEVVAVGRVRRRWFRIASGATQSATELVADSVLPATDRRRVRAALNRATASLEA